MKSEKIIWQAHRGGGLYEAPDNTIAALLYGWNLGGIPEVDIRLTADDELICLHDDTLARTTDAPESIANLPVRQLVFDEIRKYDAGKKFDLRFAGEKIPTLREVFEKMKLNPARELFVDISHYDEIDFPPMLNEFANLTREYGLASRLTAASCDYALNRRIREAVRGVRIIHWIGYWGPEDAGPIKLRIFEDLAACRFAGLDEVQMHLHLIDPPRDDWPYDVSATDLSRLLETCTREGIDFQVFPFEFTERSLCDLLRLGLTRFATDEPARFKHIIDINASWDHT